MPDPVNYHGGVALPELSLPVGINMFPRPRGAAPFYHEPKRHLSRHALILAMAVRGWVSVNQNLLPLCGNNALLIFPGQMHYYVQLMVPPRRWLFVTFHLDQDLALAGLRDAPAMIDAGAWRLVDVLAADYLDALRQRPEAATRLAFTLWRLLWRLASLRAHHPMKQTGDFNINRQDHNLVAKIHQHLESNFSHDLNVESIAAAVGVSRSRLQARFHAIMGMGIANFIRRHRLKHACLMLSRTDDSMAAIGEQCGFSSIYVFSRTFKRVLGITPKAYRQRVRRR